VVTARVIILWNHIPDVSKIQEHIDVPQVLDPPTIACRTKEIKIFFPYCDMGKRN
jgi:hypothetical protein